MLKRTMSEKSGRSRKFYHRLLNPDTVLMLLNPTLHKQTPVFIQSPLKKNDKTQQKHSLLFLLRSLLQSKKLNEQNTCTVNYKFFFNQTEETATKFQGLKKERRAVRTV